MIRPSKTQMSGLLEVMGRFPLALTALVTLSIFANLLTLTGSVFMLQVYDRVLTSRSIPTLVALTILMAVMYVFFVAIESLRTRIAARLADMWSAALSRRLFSAYVRQGLADHDRLDPLRDLELVRIFLGGAGLFVLLDMPWLPLYLALIYALHPLLGWLAILGAMAITIILIVNEMQSRQAERISNSLFLQRVTIAESAQSNAESVFAMGMLKQISARWWTAAELLAHGQRGTADQLAFYTAASRGFRYFLQSAVLALGAYLVIEGEMTAGLMIAASIITARALAPVEQAVAHWRGFVGARQAFMRIEAALLAESDQPVATELPRPSRQLVVANVSVSPARDQRPLAAGVNFTLVAGDGLGIVGMSGSGKSTLARALVGVWPLVAGQIRLDGSELTHYDGERLGAFTGYLPQSVGLFQGTIAENISRFQPGDVNGAVLKAAEQSCVHELITALPRGYDTQVGRNGSILSAGQRQRIGLARALYGDPFLIVLDEPNSNLDSEGEEALTSAILGARARGAIVVVVAHRPSAIAAVDMLLFMENGRQLKFGEKTAVMLALGVSGPRTSERLD